MHQLTIAPLFLSLLLSKNSHSLSLTEKKHRKLQKHVIWTFWEHLQKGIPWSLLIRVGGLNKTLQNSHKFFLFDWGHRFLARTQENNGLLDWSIQHFTILKSEDKPCAQSNCRLGCSVNTQRWFEDCDLVTWAMCLCGQQEEHLKTLRCTDVFESYADCTEE